MEARTHVPMSTGLSLVSPWSLLGLSLVSLWSLFGLSSLVSLWSFLFGLSLVSPLWSLFWSLFGLSSVFLWSLLGGVSLWSLWWCLLLRRNDGRLSVKRDASARLTSLSGILGWTGLQPALVLSSEDISRSTEEDGDWPWQCWSAVELLSRVLVRARSRGPRRARGKMCACERGCKASRGSGAWALCDLTPSSVR